MGGGEAEAATGGEVVEGQLALRLDQDRADPGALRCVCPGTEQSALIRRVHKQDAAGIEAQFGEAGTVRRAAGLEPAEPEQRPLRRETQRSQSGEAERASAIPGGSGIDFM